MAMLLPFDTAQDTALRLDYAHIFSSSHQKTVSGGTLMFWSGADLNVKGKKFKDASIFYNKLSEIQTNDLTRWLKKSREIQWDYKNIVKRKGRLEKLK